MIGNNWAALCVTFGFIYLWLRINDYLAHSGIIGSPLSRKIIHIGTGPIFILCWLLFNDSVSARYLAAFVPLGITIQFFLIGIGVLKDQASVDAMSRSGDRREILKGPLYYGIVFVIITVFYWKDSPIGIIALMLLCGGDGLADVLGRRIISKPLPWSKGKTWAGTLSMLIGGWLATVLIVWVYTQIGIFPGSMKSYLFGMTIIACAGTLVESLPFRDIDNITVPSAALLMGYLFF